MTQFEAVRVSGLVSCCELRQLVNVPMSQRMRLTPPAGSGLEYTSRCTLHASPSSVVRAGQHQVRAVGQPRADGQAFSLFRGDAAQAG